MSYFFELKFIDINSLVDFSDLENCNLGLKSVQPNEQDKNLQKPENNSVPATEVFQTISEKVSVAETVKKQPEAMSLPPLSDPTARYIGFIQNKFEAAASAELVRILLNPYVLSLGYMFDFDELKSTFSYNQMSFANLPSGNLLSSQTGERKNGNFAQDLSEMNLRRDLEKKLQKEIELKNELNKKLSYHRRY